MDTNPIAIVALSDIVAAKELKAAKDALLEGSTSNFQFSAAFKGTLTKGVAVEKDATCTLLNEAVFAETMRRLGVTRQAWEVTLFDVAMEAHVAGIPLKEKLIADHPALLETIFILKRDVIAKLPKTRQSGAVKVIGTYDVKNLKVA